MGIEDGYCPLRLRFSERNYSVSEPLNQYGSPCDPVLSEKVRNMLCESARSICEDSEASPLMLMDDLGNLVTLEELTDPFYNPINNIVFGPSPDGFY